MQSLTAKLNPSCFQKWVTVIVHFIHTSPPGLGEPAKVLRDKIPYTVVLFTFPSLVLSTKRGAKVSLSLWYDRTWDWAQVHYRKEQMPWHSHIQWSIDCKRRCKQGINANFSQKDSCQMFCQKCPLKKFTGAIFDILNGNM